MASILQSWVSELGLRHQGVLLTAIRGCDTLPKEHPSKTLTRALRCDILVSHCADPRKSSSFIEYFENEAFDEVAKQFLADLDEYPVHYLMHLTHAAEILGYYHPRTKMRWLRVYLAVVRKLHMNPETQEQLDRRLNKSEEEFKAAQ